MSESPITAASVAPPEGENDGAVRFTPVPTARARHDGWTPLRQREFITRLAMLGLVGPAARAVGMSPKSAYALRKRAGAESFAAAWDAALVLGRQTALCQAIDRALNGVTTPVFYRGRRIGERVRYNDRLTIAALTGRVPVRSALADPPDFAAMLRGGTGPVLR